MKFNSFLLFLAVALGATSVEAQCPGGYLNLADVGSPAPICIRFAQSMRANWYVWRAYCQADGADLAKVTGDLHRKLIQYIMSQPDMLDESFWVGGTDVMSEGDWVWVADNSAIDMGPPSWYPCTQEPESSTLENFLCLSAPDFYFHSCKDDQEIFAICQI